MTTTGSATPEQWAIRISHILNAALGVEHFPIDIAQVAQELSRTLYPDDPISLIKGHALPSFEGALVRAPPGKKGWGILFSTSIASPGRINFTLAHEFGHYLLHRLDYPNGFRCSTQDMVRWDSEYARIEYQANVFASFLLMPLDDFRKQLPPSVAPDLDLLGACADRYGVSLTAAALKWLSFTSRRAVLVLSRDGFILWARSSNSALRTGAYIKTANRTPRPIPATSLAARRGNDRASAAEMELDEGVWFPREPCTELALISDRYDLTISLLHLGAAPTPDLPDEDDEGLHELRAPDWT